MPIYLIRSTLSVQCFDYICLQYLEYRWWFTVIPEMCDPHSESAFSFLVPFQRRLSRLMARIELPSMYATRRAKHEHIVASGSIAQHSAVRAKLEFAGDANTGRAASNVYANSLSWQARSFPIKARGNHATLSRDRDCCLQSMRQSWNWSEPSSGVERAERVILFTLKFLINSIKIILLKSARYVDDGNTRRNTWVYPIGQF